MFSKLQKEIINAVVAVTSHKDDTDDEEKWYKYWERNEESPSFEHQRGEYFDLDEDLAGGNCIPYRHCLYVKVIDGIPYLAVEELVHDEYGTLTDRFVCGYLSLSPSGAFATATYAELIEKLLKPFD